LLNTKVKQIFKIVSHLPKLSWT